MTSVVIVIPFYQTQSGLLIKALTSVMAQDYANFLVCIIDDGSPISASREVALLTSEQQTKCHVIEQNNLGPAAARNQGILWARKQQAEFVAFLDSDDVWLPHHLSTALTSLGNHASFFFSDALHRNKQVTTFASKQFPSETQDNVTHMFEQSYQYDGDLFDLILQQRCPFTTPSVVYRLSAIDILFREDLRVAGEDYFFWLQVAYSKQSIVFSTNITVQLGYGVGIYDAVMWGSNEKLQQLIDNWRYWNELPLYFKLTKHQLKLQGNLLNRWQHEFAENLIHICYSKEQVKWRFVWRYLCLNPKVISELVKLISQKIMQKAIKLLKRK